MEENKMLVYDPYSSQYFYLNHEELHKKMLSLNGVYTGKTHCAVTDGDKKEPCIYLEIDENIIKGQCE